jgi:3-hydroxyacyl-CoA dehydrogenase
VETRDTAGFIVNRLLVPYLLDGNAAPMRRASVESTPIDEAMKAGAGPIRWAADPVGLHRLDTLGAIADVMFDEFREAAIRQ